MDAPESMSNPMQQLASVFVEQRPALLRFVRRRLDDHALAEDLVQETWVRASSSDLSAVGNVRAYLFRIASNLSLDHLRRNALGIEVFASEETVLQVIDPQPTPEMHVQHRDELEALLAALDTLPPRAREVFVMHRLQGLEYAQIAEKLGITRSTAMVHVARALAMLDRHLNGDEQVGGSPRRGE